MSALGAFPGRSALGQFVRSLLGARGVLGGKLVINVSADLELEYKVTSVTSVSV